MSIHLQCISLTDESCPVSITGDSRECRKRRYESLMGKHGRCITLRASRTRYRVLAGQGGSTGTYSHVRMPKIVSPTMCSAAHVSKDDMRVRSNKRGTWSDSTSTVSRHHGQPVSSGIPISSHLASARSMIHAHATQTMHMTKEDILLTRPSCLDYLRAYFVHWLVG